MSIKKKIDKRQLIESGENLVNSEIHLVFNFHRFSIPQSRKEGEGKRLLYQDTKNK